MASPENVLDTYFRLSDTAGSNRRDFEQLVGLFSPDAVVTPNQGQTVSGAQAVRDFFESFFSRNVLLRHVWTTRPDSSSGVAVDWAVAGRRQDGGVFALAGTDTATLGPDGKITTLQVQAA